MRVRGLVDLGIEPGARDVHEAPRSDRPVVHPHGVDRHDLGVGQQSDRGIEPARADRLGEVVTGPGRQHRERRVGSRAGRSRRTRPCRPRRSPRRCRHPASASRRQVASMSAGGVRHQHLVIDRRSRRIASALPMSLPAFPRPAVGLATTTVGAGGRHIEPRGPGRQPVGSRPGIDPVLPGVGTIPPAASGGLVVAPALRELGLRAVAQILHDDPASSLGPSARCLRRPGATFGAALEPQQRQLSCCAELVNKVASGAVNPWSAI